MEHIAIIAAATHSNTGTVPVWWVFDVHIRYLSPDFLTVTPGVRPPPGVQSTPGMISLSSPPGIGNAFIGDDERPTDN